MKPIWKVESLEQLARAANSTPDFAALFPAVLAASREGTNWRKQPCGRQRQNWPILPALWCNGFFRSSGAGLSRWPWQAASFVIRRRSASFSTIRFERRILTWF
jgi:hypothetical protein